MSFTICKSSRFKYKLQLNFLDSISLNSKGVFFYYVSIFIY